MHEQDILKYIDNELSKEEKEAFEVRMLREPELKSQLEEVRAKRQEVLEAIGMLNPPEPVEIPDIGSLLKTGKKRNLFSLRSWRVAAAVLILAAASIAYFLIPGSETENTITAENNEAKFFEDADHCSELDYYISPNRCWNRRELVWTMINKKE